MDINKIETIVRRPETKRISNRKNCTLVSVTYPPLHILWRFKLADWTLSLENHNSSEVGTHVIYLEWFELLSAKHCS